MLLVKSIIFLKKYCFVADAPKTSEYAYFKKVKNSAGCGHSGATHREDKRLEDSKFNDCSGGNPT